MSGLLGALTHSRRDALAVLDAMAAAVPAALSTHHSPWLSSSGCVAFSAERRRSYPGPLDLAHDPDTGVLCVVDGTVFPMGDASTDLTEAGPAAHLLGEFHRGGVQALSRFGGNFNVAWWNERERSLTLATDRSGYRHLHYQVSGDDVVFSSWLGPVLAGAAASPRFDEESLADFFTYRYLPGERTLYRDVWILPPAGYLTVSGGTVRTGRYWRIDEILPENTYDRGMRDRLDADVRRAVRRCGATGASRTLVALTGGLDSRVLLAACLAEGMDVKTMTDGAPDSTDLALARECSSTVGVEHTYEETDTGSLASLVPLAVELQCASAPDLKPHSGRVVCAPTADRVMTGIVGNVFRHAAMWRLSSPSLATVLEVSTGNANSEISKRLDPGFLWLPDRREAATTAARDHLHAVHHHYDLAYRPLKLAAYMSIEQSGRRGLGRATVSHAWGRETGNPYVDPDLLDTLLSLPVRERITHPIQLELIGLHESRLLDLPFNKPKGPFHRSDLTDRLHRESRRWVQRLKRRLSVPTTPTVNAFPYERWHGGPMREAIVSRIRKPDAVWRRYLDEHRVLPLVEEHLRGERSWFHLVSGLTILEVARELWGG